MEKEDLKRRIKALKSMDLAHAVRADLTASVAILDVLIHDDELVDLLVSRMEELRIKQLERYERDLKLAESQTDIFINGQE